MGRFRYLIERGPDQQAVVEDEAGEVSIVDAPFVVTVITPGDDTGYSSGAYQSVEAAQASAEQMHLSDGSEDADDHPLKWKDPPEAWKPDAIAVSQYLDDGVEENRDP